MMVMMPENILFQRVNTPSACCFSTRTRTTNTEHLRRQRWRRRRREWRTPDLTVVICSSSYSSSLWLLGGVETSHLHHHPQLPHQHLVLTLARRLQGDFGHRLVVPSARARARDIHMLNFTATTTTTTAAAALYVAFVVKRVASASQRGFLLMFWRILGV